MIFFLIIKLHCKRFLFCYQCFSIVHKIPKTTFKLYNQTFHWNWWVGPHRIQHDIGCLVWIKIGMIFREYCWKTSVRRFFPFQIMLYFIMACPQPLLTHYKKKLELPMNKIPWWWLIFVGNVNFSTDFWRPKICW